MEVRQLVHVSAAEQTGSGTGVSVGVGEGVGRDECEGEGVGRSECEGEWGRVSVRGGSGKE